jgi:predicted DNA-binding protein (MmcQ/YjbR family)
MARKGPTDQDGAETGSRQERAGEQVIADSLRDRVIAACSAKPGSAEDYPFGDEVAVFKVVGKMFALVTLGPSPCSVSLKCDPDLAAGLRRRYAAITAGYHLHKRHWNTVTLDGSVPEAELLDLIDHSYELVVARLPRAERDKLNT